MAPVIKAEKLFKRYPGFAPVLRGADISVEPGEMVAVMGPSGCGKSTMLHILGLLHAPDSGTLEILNKDVLTFNREETAAFRRGNLGFVMQASNLFEHSTVFENVEFPLIYENVPPQERWERVIRALDLVRLSARVHYPSNRLSGGEQQRVAIARAMVNNPRILLADEPTGALDTRTSGLIMENFRTLCHSGGVALVMVTHDPKMAEYCDTIYTLEEGVLNCKRKGTAPFTNKMGENFLKVPDPVIFGALITQSFPEQGEPDLLALASRLHAQEMLARIYAMHEQGLWESSEYALPLAVRRMGFWTRLVSGLFKSHVNGQSVWKIAKSLPGGSGFFKHFTAIAASSKMAIWAKEDNIQFLFAPSAQIPAISAWCMANILKLPFAFQIQPRDLRHFSKAWEKLASEAIFVLCPTRQVLNEIKKLLPALDSSKLLLVYEPPVVMPQDDEGESIQDPSIPKLLEILMMGPDVSAKGFETALNALGQLKKANVVFGVSIFALPTWKNKRLVKRAGIQADTTFLGLPNIENIAESYKNADIFVAFPPANPDQQYAVPLYIRQAMIFGLAIITCGLTLGMSEVLKNGKSCLESPAGDANSLFLNLQKLANDKNLVKKLGESAHADLLQLINLQANSHLLNDLIVQSVAVDEERKTKILAKSNKLR